MREHNARDRSAGDCGAGRADVTPTADVTPVADVATASDVTAHSDGTPAAGVVYYADDRADGTDSADCTTHCGAG